MARPFSASWQHGACLSAALLALAPTAASSELDIGRLVAGRTMYAEGAWALDSFHTYSAPSLRDPAADSFRASFELERGQTRRFNWESGLTTTRARRDLLRLDRLAFGVRGLALDSPLELALAAEWAPSLQGEGPEWEAEAETLLNLGRNCALVGQYSGEIEPGLELHHQFILGPLLRFGLQGLAGLQAVYQTHGFWSAQAVIGGAVSRNVFISVQPRVGINERAPDAAVMLELHGLFGPYAFGAWGLK